MKTTNHLGAIFCQTELNPNDIFIGSITPQTETLMQYEELYAYILHCTASCKLSLDSKKKTAKTALHFPTARNQFRSHFSGKNHLIFPMCGSTILPIIFCKAVSFSNPTSVLKVRYFPWLFGPFFCWEENGGSMREYLPSQEALHDHSNKQRIRKHPKARSVFGPRVFMGIWLLDL